MTCYGENENCNPSSSPSYKRGSGIALLGVRVGESVSVHCASAQARTEVREVQTKRAALSILRRFDQT